MADTKQRRSDKDEALTRGDDSSQSSGIRVEDRRHWARSEDDDVDEDSAPVSTQPTIVDEYRQRAEQAESRLREYIAAFKEAEAEREEFRLRLQRDVERRVELRYGELLGEILDAVDQLELAVEHVEGIAEAKAVADGVLLVRDRFLNALGGQGVEPVRPDGETFDPNIAEALRVDPVNDPEQDGKVTQTLQPGYRLGERIIRPAKVAVGKTAT